MNESFVTVVGNVVSDPISRPTKVGRPFASLRIASTTRRWDPEKRAFVDGSTNFLNVVAFNALAANVMTSVKKGHPVVVYGRLRVNQWETEKGEPRTSAEIDAYTIGHDLTRGQVEFSRPPRLQLDSNDRLADPAIQDSFHGDEGGADHSGRGDDRPTGAVHDGGYGGDDGGNGGDDGGNGDGDDGGDGPGGNRGGNGLDGRGGDGFGMPGRDAASPGSGVVVQGGFGENGFGRRVEDADTDDYVVVSGG